MFFDHGAPRWSNNPEAGRSTDGDNVKDTRRPPEPPGLAESCIPPLRKAAPGAMASPARRPETLRETTDPVRARRSTLPSPDRVSLRADFDRSGFTAGRLLPH
jgi:hypothetical protein